MFPFLYPSFSFQSRSRLVRSDPSQLLANEVSASTRLRPPRITTAKPAVSNEPSDASSMRMKSSLPQPLQTLQTEQSPTLPLQQFPQLERPTLSLLPIRRTQTSSQCPPTEPGSQLQQGSLPAFRRCRTMPTGEEASELRRRSSRRWSIQARRPSFLDGTQLFQEETLCYHRIRTLGPQSEFD